MFAWLRRLFRPITRLVVRGRYDAASTTDENRRHWGQADGLSAAAANSLGVRTKLRNRSRYERDNNGYAKRLARRLSRDLVGTGPRLQVLTGDAATDRAVERAWQAWAKGVALARKLRTLAQARVVDGEAFALFVTNDALPSSVKLDLKPLECDQVTTPAVPAQSPLTNHVDGIDYDAAGNPAAYYVLRHHPGDAFAAGSWGAYDRVPARLVCHWYEADRPGQARGVPETTASLPLFAQVRRYTLATLTAAETAASFAAVLQTEAPPDAETDEPTPFETLEIERGMLTTLPAGAALNQLKAEQPTTTYDVFKNAVLKEIAAPLSVPWNVMSGDSSGYNYSSARMDHLLYRSDLRIDRQDCEEVILDRLFAAWLDEATRIPGLLPDGLSAVDVPHAWFWPGFESIDPNKEAAADTERLTNNTTTLQEILAEYGQDWEAFLRQRAREVALAKSLGLIPEPPPPQTLGANGGGSKQPQ